ncbi:pol polyprotein [Tanacetum coccineum]|uniref:Pol polyprotein n=1 Tax=Tanacetum coccineum TaxID=301880 RepID=A0ABQ5IJ82_9ASTR
MKLTWKNKNNKRPITTTTITNLPFDHNEPQTSSSHADDPIKVADSYQAQGNKLAEGYKHSQQQPVTLWLKEKKRADLLNFDRAIRKTVDSLTRIQLEQRLNPSRVKGWINPRSKQRTRMVVGESSQPPVKDTTLTFQCPILTSTNYTIWRMRMEVLLGIHGVWDVVDPGSDDAKKNNIVKGLLFQSIPKDLVLQIGNLKTGKDMWEAIKTRNLGADRVKEARLQTLITEFENMKILDNGTIDEYAAKLSALEQVLDLKTTRFEDVVGRLKAYEERVKEEDKANDPQENLLYARTEYSNGNNDSSGGRGRGSYSRGRGRGRGQGRGRDNSQNQGIEVSQGKDCVEIKQKRYAMKILKEACMEECNPALCPMEPGLKLSKAEDEPEVEATQYRKMVGCLRYLLHTGPDLTYSVGVGYCCDDAVDVLFIVGKYREALGKWEAAITLMPERAALHEQKAQVLLEMGETWKSITAATRATQLEPSWPEAWVTLGRAQLNFGEPDSAIESFDKALAIKPDSVEVKEDRKTALHLVKKRKQLHSAGLNDSKKRYVVLMGPLASEDPELVIRCYYQVISMGKEKIIEKRDMVKMG